jgi:hypothetical protein
MIIFILIISTIDIALALVICSILVRSGIVLLATNYYQLPASANCSTKTGYNANPQSTKNIRTPTLFFFFFFNTMKNFQTSNLNHQSILFLFFSLLTVCGRSTSNKHNQFEQSEAGGGGSLSHNNSILSGGISPLSVSVPRINPASFNTCVNP